LTHPPTPISAASAASTLAFEFDAQARDNPFLKKMFGKFEILSSKFENIPKKCLHVVNVVFYQCANFQNKICYVWPLAKMKKNLKMTKLSRSTSLMFSDAKI
jgi:hypothetical protein